MGCCSFRWSWRKKITVAQTKFIGRVCFCILALFFYKLIYISMPKIIYVTHDDQTHTVEVQNGLTVMEGAVQNDIPGIDADCGGGMACATCHVYVKDDWFDKIPPKEDGEEDMLDMAFEPKKNSRLSCQLTVSDELNGLIVNIPSKQS